MIIDNITNSTKSAQIFLLLKFGKEEHLKALQEKGTLYLSSIEELRKADNFRNDSYEGALRYISQPSGGTATAQLPDGKTFSFKFLKASVMEYHEFILGNISSFYAISSNNFKNGEFMPVDERMQEFGTHVILINNVDKFFQLINDKIKELKLNCYYGLVEYFDENTHNGKIHLFHKRNRYEYQNELRIYIDTKINTSYKIDLGNLKDISSIGKSDTIHQLKITPHYTL